MKAERSSLYVAFMCVWYINVCFIAGNVKCDISKIEGPAMMTLTEVVVVLHRGVYSSYISISAWRLALVSFR